jgi:NTE family protein
MIIDRPSYLYPTPGRVALVLAGGAARGAYEVGILQYIAEEVTRDLGRDPPLDIFCGTSVGAINGCALAAFADTPRTRIHRLTTSWRSLRVDDVVRINPSHVSKFLRSAFGPAPLQSAVTDERYGGIIDPVGMEHIIRDSIPFARIEEHLRSGLLWGVTVSATHIATGNTLVFVSRHEPGLPRWSRDPKVVARRVTLRISHALASAAIPLMFPAVRIDGEFYCDGGLRQNVPLSPARHLGANRVLVISPRYIDEVPPLPERPDPQARMPGPAFLVGKALNSLLLDRVENDIERLQRINELLLAGQRRYGPEFVREINLAMGHKDPERGLRPLRALLVRSSQNMGKMAAEYVRSKQFGQRASGMVSRLLHKVADQTDNEADLLSYVLFDGEFAGQLIELGRKDARAQHRELCEFFTQEDQK